MRVASGSPAGHAAHLVSSRTLWGVRALRPVSGLAVALVTGAALSACGVGASTPSNLTGDSKAVAQTIANLAADAQSRNNSKICDNDLARAVVNRLDAGSSTCASVISKQLGEADDFTLGLAPGSAITVTGSTATARVKDTYLGHKSHVDVLRLVREGAAWKVAGVGPGA